MISATELVRACRARGMSQKKISRITGYSQPVISRVESDDYVTGDATLEDIKRRLSYYMQPVVFFGEWFLLRKVK